MLKDNSVDSDDINDIIYLYGDKNNCDNQKE